MHKIIIIDDEQVEKVDQYRNWKQISQFHEVGALFHKVTIRQRECKSTIVIAPAAIEHYSCYDLFKLRIYCERHNIQVIGFGSLNQLPYLSLISDEVVMLETKLSFYEGEFTACGAGSLAIEHDPEFCAVLQRHPKNKEVYQLAQLEVTNQEVADRFANFEVFIRKSSYQTYECLNFPQKQISCQISCDGGPGLVGREMVKKLQTISMIYPFFNIKYGPCKRHLNQVGHHFLSHQILLSWLSDWFYICCGGAGSLMSIVPVKLLHVQDRNYNNVSSICEKQREDHKQVGIINKDISRRIALKRYGEIGSIIPCMNEHLDIDLLNEAINGMPKIDVEVICP